MLRHLRNLQPPRPIRATSRSRAKGACALVAAALCLAAPARAQQPESGSPAPAGSPAMPDPTALFNAAVNGFDKGDYQGALNAIDQLFKQIPSDLPDTEKAKLNKLLEPVYFTRGAAYFNLRQFAQAVTALDDYLKRYPKSARAAEVTYSLAQAHYLNKDFALAAKAAEPLAANPAFREQALMLAGLSYRETSEDAKAVAALEQLTNGGIHSPTAARGAMQLIFLYGRQGKPDKALKMLSEVQANIDQLENVVDLNSVALEQGDTYLQNNSNQEALICYRAVRTREQVMALQRERIAALQKRLDANRGAARANPKDAPQYFLANRQLLDSIAEDQRLLDGFEKLPAIYPKILYRMGRAYTQMGSSWEASVAYEDSYERSSDPTDRESALFAVITSFVDVSQAAAARAGCDAYLKEFPKGANAYTVGYLLGATALQENDPKAAEQYFGRMLTEQPGSTMREEMRFLLANALLAQGKYDEAEKEYKRYQQDFPHGSHFEESVYRVALATLFAGQYEEAFKQLGDFLKKYPSSGFVSDARYRLDVCKYAANKYDEVAADMRAWLKQFPDDPEQGEAQALLGDAETALGKSEEALAAYQASYKVAATDEVLSYSLQEASKIFEKRADWDGDAAMFQDFVQSHPDNPAVVMALAQIGRAKMKEGRVDEAKHFLADTLGKYIDDRRRSSVEQVLDQLAMLCVRKKSVAAAPSVTKPEAPAGTVSPDAAAAATPSPVAAPDPAAELDELLGASEADRSPTAQARILYAKASLARLRRQPAEATRDWLAIAAKFKPDVLSPTLLGQVGDALLANGQPDAAVPFYQELLDTFPKDDNVDFAYAGLGEIAFERKQYDRALDYFDDGVNKIAANQKLKDVTVGEAKALQALGRYDEAAKLFGQAASVKEWRGETTVFCMYSLGEIEAKKGHWAEANAYYQRIYVAYQRFLPWVAKAYLGSGNSLEKLGKTQDAVKTYQEMLRNPKLTESAEAAVARQRLQALGAS